ncbi:MAG: SEC-C metal-binding domain-containing protein, partial [Patescibacteria group bacterium]
MRIFGGEQVAKVMSFLKMPEETPIEHGMVSKAIEGAQRKVEGHNFDIRKYVLEYDDVMNRHRTAIYSLRKEILEEVDTKTKISDYIHEQVDKIVQFHAASEMGPSVQTEKYNTEEIAESIKAIVPMEDDLHTKLSEIAKLSGKAGEPNKLSEFLHGLIGEAYAGREKQVGPEAMRHLEKMVLLRVIDELWVDHLEQMEYLRDSVRLRAYGQRDPLVEYKIEGQKMFNQLQGAIGAQVAGLIFKVGFINQPKAAAIEEKRENVAHNQSEISKQMRQEAIRATLPHSKNKVGRNDPCYCGSGKKYKRCHGV